MRRLKLIISYDGTVYHGWQVQKGLVTVQSTIQDAFEKVVGKKVNVYASGRTDAGVHARGQVGLVVIEGEIPLYNLLAGVNSLLPEDIAILSLEEVGEEFHPRFSAKGKHYRYVIRNSKIRDVFDRKYCWLVYHPLDIAAMNKAAEKFIGTHDFSSFRSSTCNNEDPAKTITKAGFVQEGEVLYFDIVGSGFLKQMVRTIVGTLVEVGKGRLVPDDIPDIIAAKNRSRAGQTAPPQGLFLMQVSY